ncbi:hypothetical protein JCM10449v2_002844 [Rhodotorula kratochvilovae]
MDDLITIRTSDDPPVELEASRAILIAGSRVFADMLSLPQGGEMGAGRATCDIAETEETFKPFLRLLNLVNEPGDPLEELCDLEWLSAVTLSDKYDSPAVRGYAKGTYWRWKEGIPDGTAKFVLATTLDDAKELKEAAFDALHPSITDIRPFSLLTPVWADRLMLKEHALQRVVHDPPDFDCSKTCDCNLADMRIVWYSSAFDALKHDFTSRPGFPFQQRMQGALSEAAFCPEHREEFDALAENFEWAYRDTAPDLLV